MAIMQKPTQTNYDKYIQQEINVYKASNGKITENLSKLKEAKVKPTNIESERAF